MPDAVSPTYQLILDKVPEEKQPDTALFLSGCFSLPPASTRGIAAAGPIALVSDLKKSQAEAILAELRPSLPEGVGIRVAAEEEGSRISRLQWPRPPKIYGSPLEDVAPARRGGPHEIKCPFCGGAISLTDDFGIAATEKRRDDTSFRAAPLPDRDPLFSGVKPLAADTGKFASIRSLQAGDTGFWMDHAHSAFAPPPRAEQERPGSGTGSGTGAATGTGHGRGRGETSAAKKTGGRPAAGLAAFMKPGAFAVVVSRTRDVGTVKMIAEIMGLSEGEARERGLNLGLCVARDIALDEAQNLLTRFRNLGAKARIVKPS